MEFNSDLIYAILKGFFWFSLGLLILKNVFKKKPKVNPVGGASPFSSIFSSMSKGKEFSLFPSSKRATTGEIVIRNLKEEDKRVIDLFEEKDTVRVSVNPNDDMDEEDNKKTNSSVQKNLPNIFVIDFEADVFASKNEHLRKIITILLQLEGDYEPDQVVFRPKGPGGIVPGHGFTYSQIMRLIRAKITTVTCIDEMAASGVILGLSPSDKVYASDFALLGSVGVAFEFPNFYGLIEKVGIKMISLTVGDKKRNLTQFMDPEGEDFKPAKEHQLKKMTTMYDKFKQVVKKYRTGVKDEFLNGDTWYAFEEDLDEIGFIDGVKTSDDYLLEHYESHDIYHISYVPPRSPRSMLETFATSLLTKCYTAVVMR